MTVIGVVGEQNAGKDALVDYLHDKHGFHKLSTGDMVRDLAEREGVPRTREKLQDVAAEIVSRRGKHFLANLLIRRIDNHDWNRIAITGLRTPADVEKLRTRYGSEFTLVRIEVDDPKTRFRRGEQRDKPRDADTYEEFLEHDRAEQELFKLDRTMQMADVSVRNNSTLDEFHREIETNVVGPRLEEAS